MITQPLKFCSEAPKQLCRHVHAFSLVLEHALQNITWYWLTISDSLINYFWICHYSLSFKKPQLRSEFNPIKKGFSGIPNLPYSLYSWNWSACKSFHAQPIQVEITAFLCISGYISSVRLTSHTAPLNWIWCPAVASAFITSSACNRLLQLHLYCPILTSNAVVPQVVCYFRKT